MRVQYHLMLSCANAYEWKSEEISSAGDFSPSSDAKNFHIIFISRSETTTDLITQGLNVPVEWSSGYKGKAICVLLFRSCSIEKNGKKFTYSLFWDRKVGNVWCAKFLSFLLSNVVYLTIDVNLLSIFYAAEKKSVYMWNEFRDVDSSGFDL